MKGPKALPIRGVLYRKYPNDFQVGRRSENSSGGYFLLNSFKEKPSTEVLDDLFYQDSDIRDKNLSFLDRLKKQIPNFGS